MIDIHTHIIPGIDDGADEIYDSLEMIKLAAKSGTTAMVATPHCNIPGMYDNYFGREYVEQYKKVLAAVKEERLPVNIMPGMEAFGTEDLPDLIVQGKIMPINQSRYILVEFPFDAEAEYVSYLLGKMADVGAIPVIAHPERYDSVQDNPHVAYEWQKKGYVVQVNKGSFEGKFGSYVRKTAYRMLSHNLISVIASDAHGYERRTPYMRDIYKELSEERTKGYMDLLFKKNPQKICMNQPLERLEPIPFSRYEL